jgi:CheY-like chemotaxis protein
MDQSKILLAEDEQDARLIYLDILKSGGFEADGAENGKRTLEMLAAKKYDVLLLDIIMPDLDGISVLSEIVKDEAKYGKPIIIMLTNIGGDLAIEKALQIGADGYMLKSETEPQDLIATVKKFLTKSEG